MIVPSPRLIFWTAFLGLPFAIVIGLVPAWAPVGIGLLSALAAVAALDAARAAGVLDNVDLEGPDVVRMSLQRAADLRLDVLAPSRRERQLRIGLVLPPEISADGDDRYATTGAQRESTPVQWSCTPTQRGRYSIDAAHVETRSPFGFWDVRRALPLRVELRVYPSLLAERKHLSALFLHRGLFGVHAQRQVGQGRDFEKLREYMPGDSYDQIHWKATAKRGHPITKIFQIERTQEVYVVLDASRLSARPAADDASTTIMERYIAAALIMCLAADQQGDRFGLLTFSDRVGRFIPARNGTAHYGVCRDMLYTLEAERVTPDFAELCTFIRLRQRRRALLVFLTSLDDPALADSFARHIEVLSRQHVVLVNMLRPPGAEPMFATPGVGSVDDLYGRLGGHLRWHDLQEFGQRLHSRGIQFAQLDDEKLSLQLVSQYVGVKQRQLI